MNKLCGRVQFWPAAKIFILERKKERICDKWYNSDILIFCNRFLGCNLRVIPVHNTADVVKGMLIIAKVTCDVLQFAFSVFL